MGGAEFDIVGIGNAIVDVIARMEDDFLVRHGMAKGGMALVDEKRAQAIYDAMGPAVEISGGSAANTTVGAAGFGARVAFIGKVKADALGGVFSHDIRAAGVTFATPAAPQGPATARCCIVVTPDGERTMNTYLGAAQNLHPDDIDAELVRAAAITYLEGYLWDPHEAKNAFRKAADIAHAANRVVALTLSDAFCVDRWRAEFLDLMRSGRVDLLFSNESEIKSLYTTADFDTALTLLREDVRLAAVTRSEKGCVIVSREHTQTIPAYPVETVVDTTGAGDLFAAGFLAGIARGMEPAQAARLGALGAAEVIGHLGARPQSSLRARAAAEGLLDAAAP